MIGFPSTEMIDLWHSQITFLIWHIICNSAFWSLTLYSQWQYNEVLDHGVTYVWITFELIYYPSFSVFRMMSSVIATSLPYLYYELLDLPWIMHVVFQEKSKLCPAVGCCGSPHSTLLHFPPFPHPHLRREVREHLVSTLDPDVSCALPISVSKVRLCV